MERWLTSDLHLGHTNIITYCERPFADVAEMNEAIVESWNAQVAPGDEVEVEGDVAMGKLTDTLPLVRRLNGRKTLRLGNHDRPHPLHGRRATGWAERYIDAGFEAILPEVGRLRVGRHRVLACHFPYRGDSKENDRFVDARPSDTGEWLVHGHVHDTWRQRGRQINVGLDAWGGRLVHVDEIAALIDAGPCELARISWPVR